MRARDLSLPKRHEKESENVDLPEYRIRNQREAVLWFCLQKSHRQRPQLDSAADSSAKKSEPKRLGLSFRMFNRRKALIAKPEPTDREHRLAEQDFWRKTLRKQWYLNVFTFFGV